MKKLILSLLFFAVFKPQISVAQFGACLLTMPDSACRKTGSFSGTTLWLDRDSMRASKDSYLWSYHNTVSFRRLNSTHDDGAITKIVHVINSSGTIGVSPLSSIYSGTSSQYVRGDGTYVTIPAATKRQETYSGTTDASGNYTVTFGVAYSVAPNIQSLIVGGTTEQGISGVTISTTGFTIHVYQRSYLLGLAQNPTNVSGAAVDVIVTEK